MHTFIACKQICKVRRRKKIARQIYLCDKAFDANVRWWMIESNHVRIIGEAVHCSIRALLMSYFDDTRRVFTRSCKNQPVWYSIIINNKKSWPASSRTNIYARLRISVWSLFLIRSVRIVGFILTSNEIRFRVEIDWLKSPCVESMGNRNDDINQEWHLKL